jgi:superoxide dismutase, Cu-Zn family
MKTMMMMGVMITLMIGGIDKGFTQADHSAMMMKSANETAVKAVCVLSPTQGNNVTGTIWFTTTDKGVRVVADIQGLHEGKHGFHIHEFGDCSSPDASSAGGHYNPMGMQHGSPMDMNRHLGDMGNLEADARGNAHLEYVDPEISLSGPNSIIGRSVVVHKEADDLKSQPAGNSGPRIACGVIGLAK